MGWNVCKIGKVSQIFRQTGIDRAENEGHFLSLGQENEISRE